jgi:type I restriction-modification system DNA methylase subunit
MAISEFQKAFTRVKSLVRQFKQNETFFLAPTYSEAQVRLDFIDKFWSALGWDVNHENQTNPYEQEVKVERGEAVKGRRQRADYAFLAQNFRDVLFFVEAKKPSADLDCADDYFQVIRYGWPNKTPVSVLTDFRRFRVLDCRLLPDIDTSLDRCVMKFHFFEYEDEDKFSEIYYLFSRDAVLAGSLGRYAERMPKPAGKAIQRGLFAINIAKEFDEAFLDDLNAYRQSLARCIQRDNQKLSGYDLTECTQRIIDRLVFMRFLEDKLIEAQPLVETLGTKSTAWRDFISLCARLDSVYNGILFKKHPIIDSASFRMDSNVFEEIRERLSHTNSPYNFNQIPIHILGSIYEQFLGKTIVVTESGAEVEEKPGVRKAGGVYYTPEYIVRFIVEQSVGVAIKGKSPRELRKMRFADIACGSGSFLLGIYDLLLRHCTAFYNLKENRVAAARSGCIKKDDGGFHLSLLQRREILLSNIFGVDVDSQAVEVAQLSLYLKLLEEETTASARQNQLELRDALLPSLGDNVKSGNSLVEWDIMSSSFLAGDDERRLNPMDFDKSFPEAMRDGGFDSIVGNPPYDVIEKNRGEDFWPHDLLQQYIRQKPVFAPALGGKLNLFRFFVVRTHQLLKYGGRVGMIVPLALAGDVSCANTRKHLMRTTSSLSINCFPQKDDKSRRVFRDAKLSTMIFTGQNRRNPSSDGIIRLSVFPGNSLSDVPRECKFRYEDAALLDPKNVPFPLADGYDWNLCMRVHRGSKVIRLGDVKDFTITRGEINQKTFRHFITSDSHCSRLIKGMEIARYFTRDDFSQGEREWLNSSYYLQFNRPRMSTNVRRIATQRITGVDERYRLVATIIEPPAYFADSTNSIEVQEESLYSLEYILAILNSSLLQWRFKITSSNNNVGTNELYSMPFRSIDFANISDRSLHNTVSNKVSRLMQCHRDRATTQSERSQEIIQRKIMGLESEINSLIGLLYELSTDELAYLEERTRKSGRSRTF